MKNKKIFLALIFISVCLFNLHAEETSVLKEANTDTERYIFIRLYDPNYNDPFYIANLLQGGITLTQVNPENVSHASIGFGLSDYFFGLTSGGKYNLKIEKCTDVAENAYMGKCNPEKSLQSTYAIKVKASEYDKAYNMILKNLTNWQLRYASADNITIAGYSVRRKFFTKEDQQNLGSKALEDKLYDIKKDFRKQTKQLIKDDLLSEKFFVCSSFVAWVMYNSISSVQTWFDSHKIDYKMVTPSDLPHIEGVEFLFTSTWTDYDNAAADFARNNPEFLNYLPLK